MKKLNGINKKNIAVFISGRGSNLKSLIKYSKLKKSRFNVKLVITNKKEVKGLGYARKNKITNFFVNYKNRNKAEKKILFFLRKNKINIICLAGFMKILSGKFIKKFKGKILNTHPSLLPKYKGLNTHKRALKNKEKYSGCTVHFVNFKLDSGKIILQKKVKITKNETEISLSKKILAQEHKLYPKAILKVFNL